MLFKLFDESEFLLGFFASLLFVTIEQEQQQQQQQKKKKQQKQQIQQINSSYWLNCLLFLEYQKQWDE